MASWGRGWEGPRGPGWTALDAQVQALAGGDVIGKADLTIGTRLASRLRGMVQLQSGAYPGSDPYLRLHPGVLIQLGPGAVLELGGEVGLFGTETVGLKLGTWVEF